MLQLRAPETFVSSTNRQPPQAKDSSRNVAKGSGTKPPKFSKSASHSPGNGPSAKRVLNTLHPPTFKVSRDPQFAERLEAIVGLYLAPPHRALVLCVDEKSQIQTLDRTQPGLPLRQGRQRTLTHDYKRHGTTTLFAALSTLDGKVIGTCLPRHRHHEFLRFLEQIDAETPPELALQP